MLSHDVTYQYMIAHAITHGVAQRRMDEPANEHTNGRTNEPAL